MKQANRRVCNEARSDGKDLGLFTLRKEEQLRNDSARYIGPAVIVGFGYPSTTLH